MTVTITKKGKGGPSSMEAKVVPADQNLGALLISPPQGEAISIGGWFESATMVEKLSTQQEALDLLQKGSTASGFFEFLRGGVLLQIRQKGWYAPHKTFAEFCENVCGFRVRKAEYLIRIYCFVMEAKVPHEDLTEIGWTKLRELAVRLEPDEGLVWISKAKTMTVLQLVDALKATALEGNLEEGGGANNEESKKITMTFSVYPEEHQMIRLALDTCKEMTGQDHDHLALERICLDFLAGSTKPLL